MNILYIAYSCDPYNGSEDKIGWNIPIVSSETNNVFVITKMEHKYVIEKYMEENPDIKIRFYFVDIPDIYKNIFKGFLYSGRLNIWNRRVYSIAKNICKENSIEIIHQITPIEFRSIGDYGKIPNIKFVCGPLGGGEMIPKSLKRYARGHKVVETIRMIMNTWYIFKYKITGKLKTCDYIMYANKETYSFMSKVGSLDKIPQEIYFDNGLSEQELVYPK